MLSVSDNQLSFSETSVGRECGWSGSKSFSSFEVLIGAESGFFCSKQKKPQLARCTRISGFSNIIISGLLQAAGLLKRYHFVNESLKGCC